MLCISENEATYFRHLTILAQTSLCHSVDVKQPHICLTWSIMMRYWLEVKAALVKLTCYNFFFFFPLCYKMLARYGGFITKTSRVGEMIQRS